MGDMDQDKTHQEKINQETEYLKILQNQYTDKAFDVIVGVQKQFHRIYRKSRRRKLNKWIWVGPRIQ